MQTIIQHVLRGANTCADKMAIIGRIQNERLVKVLVPPANLVEDHIVDLEGIVFPFGILVFCCGFPSSIQQKKKLIQYKL